MKTPHTSTRYLSVPDGENMIHDHGFSINYKQHNVNSFIMLALLPQIMTQVNMVMTT